MAVTPKQKREIKEEAGFKCAIPNCNATSPLEIHHIVHQANGGTDNNDNLICLCGNCHGRYHLGEIPVQSINNYKLRVRRISLAFFPHEYNYLAALNHGEIIELNPENVNMARRLEEENFVTIIELDNGQFELNITAAGTQFIQ